MNAHVAAPEHAVSHRFRPALTGLLQSVLVTGSAMLWFVAVWMLVRRLTGQLHQPLGFLPLLILGVVLVSISALLRLGWRAVAPNQPRLSHLVAFVAPLPALSMLAVAVSMTGTSTSALFVFWGMLFVSEVLWWFFAWQRDWIGPPTIVERTSEASVAESAPEVVDQNEASGELPSDAELGEVDTGDWLAEGMTQQLTRIDAADGTQTVEGVLRSQFAPGERSRSLHVAFCPPLQSCPVTTVTQMSGPRCHIKAADVQTYGVRFDVRLASSSDLAEEVMLHFEVISAVKS
jgi:hypothetical protein